MSIDSTKYKRILEGYRQRSLHNAGILQRRRDDIIRQLPEYKTLEDEIADVSLEKARLLMGAGGSSSDVMNELKDRLSDLKRKKLEVLTNAGYPADHLDPIYDCPACRDTGFVDNRPCSCLRNRINEALYEQSNIKDILEKENFTHLTYKYYNDEEKAFMERVVRESKNFIASFDDSSKGILFFGSTGSGKTFLSNCISKELLDSGRSVIYFTAPGLFDHLARYTFGREDQPSCLPEDIYSCDLLVIDDLGSETTNSFVSSQLFIILNERHLRGRSTLISTNLTLTQIREIYSERCSSRIIADFNLYRFDGRDMRPLMQGYT
ncbi:MAG: ATP-binding protein [Lachnospiraceae bacterium]|nr:ATP-binding protein [Lachnospiraceae bacterium]